jgi:Na+/proline symporter
MSGMIIASIVLSYVVVGTAVSAYVFQREKSFFDQSDEDWILVLIGIGWPIVGLGAAFCKMFYTMVRFFEYLEQRKKMSDIPTARIVNDKKEGA